MAGFAGRHLPAIRVMFLCLVMYLSISWVFRQTRTEGDQGPGVHGRDHAAVAKGDAGSQDEIMRLYAVRMPRVMWFGTVVKATKYLLIDGTKYSISIVLIVQVKYSILVCKVLCTTTYYTVWSSHIARLRINRVRLPILLVVS